MIADLHMHTEFSCDSDADMEASVRHAIEKKLDRICFTEHVDFNPVDYGYLYYNPPLYFEKLNRMRDLYGESIRILAGMEFGEPHLYGEELQKLSVYPYDYIIGSIHWIGSTFPSHAVETQWPVQDFFDLYWEEVLRMVKHGGFDCLGHIDFPKRYYGELHYSEVKVREIYQYLLDQDMVMEINTSALRKGYKETLPGRELLEIYKDCGGIYVTIGSDAHEPRDVGADRETARQLIRDLGLQEVVYEQRRRSIV